MPALSVCVWRWPTSAVRALPRYTRYLTPGAYSALLAKYERPADNGGIGVTVRNVAGARLGQVEVVSV